MRDKPDKQVVKIVETDTGDWVEVFDGDKEVYAGHIIPAWVWIEFLEKLGVKVIVETVPGDPD